MNIRLITLLIILGLLGLSSEGLGQKTDVLYLNNGDRITGEIKSLEFGKLKFSTNHASTIYVDWDDIYTLKSDKFLDINLFDGERIFGSIDSSLDSGYVIIRELVGGRKTPMLDIVDMTPIKNTFWSRIDGVIEIGGSYTKASQVGQLNGKFNAEYRGQKFLTGYRSSIIFTEQPERPTAQKADVALYFTRFMVQNWYIRGSANGERNTELGLDWRMLYGGSIGHDFFRTVFSRFDGSVGLFYNGEKGLDSANVTSSVEFAASISYKLLRYNSPKVDLYTGLIVYPSLTESQRIRAQYDLQTNFEIIKDLYVGVDFYFSFDNKPRSENASESDYGIVGKVGYKF